MNTKRKNRRSGISLFEVLISMLVAAIGIFGVILLIPFAWETAERGIDRENAINAAKNYFADLQAYGYHRYDSWYDDVADVQRATIATPNAANQHQPTVASLNTSGYQTSNNIIAGWPYVIDPIGADIQNAGGNAYDQFPLDPTDTLVNYLPRLNQISFLDPNAAPANGLGTELARRIAWQRDDLVFQEPATELGPPRQAWFDVEDVPSVKRQYDGRYAMISFVVPEDDAGRQYRIYTLIGKAGDRDSERIFRLDPPPNGGGDARGYQGVLLGGGDIVMTETTDTAPDSLQSIDEHQIRNGDWIMLINYHRTDTTMDPAADPMFDDIQMNFYQVLNASKTNDIPTDLEHNVTLQGPDFDVFRDWDYTQGAPAVATQTETYAILIPNVLAIYERTFRVEESSVWANQ